MCYEMTLAIFFQRVYIYDEAFEKDTQSHIEATKLYKGFLIQNFVNKI